MLPAASASALQLRGCGHCDQNCSVWLLLPESRRRRRPRGWHTGLCLATKLLEYMGFDVRCRGGQRNMFGLPGPQNKGRRFAARRHRRFLPYAGPKPGRNRLQLAKYIIQREMRLLTFSCCSSSFLPLCLQAFRPEAHLIICGSLVESLLDRQRASMYRPPSSCMWSASMARSEAYKASHKPPISRSAFAAPVPAPPSCESGRLPSRRGAHPS